MTKRAQSIQTRDSLLDAAQHLFAQSGFDATSVASICEAAGVSKGAFYHHFSSKQSLFFMLIQRWLDNLEARLREIESQSEGTPGKLLSMAHVVGDVLDEGGPRLSIYLEFWNQALRDREVHNLLSQPFDDFLFFFSELLKQGTEHDLLANGNAEKTARVITALGIGFLFQGLIDPDAANWTEMTEFGLKLLLRGLGTEDAI